MGVGGQRRAPSALPPTKGHGTHCTGGWVGQRGGLNGCGNNFLRPPDFEPRTVRPVESRYTAYAVQAYSESLHGLRSTLSRPVASRYTAYAVQACSESLHGLRCPGL